MRLKLIILFLATCAPIALLHAAPAATDPRTEQVHAATSNAIDALSESIAAEQITPELTVKDFLEKTKSTDRFTESLRRSQQIGGPRWVDQTCQVRLEISGTRARATLIQIATTEGKKSPLAGDVLALRLKDWDKRTFAATGSSASASDLDKAKPAPADDVWAQVSDDARRTALQAAKEDAIDRAINSVGDVELPTKVRVSDAMKDEAVRKDVEQWLQTRPVTEIEFRQDRQVYVTVAAAPNEFAEQLRKSLVEHGKPVAGAEAWAHVSESLSGKLNATGAVEGSAGLADKSPAATAPAIVQLPALPPIWANEQREAEGSAPAGDSQLKAARAAEVDAVGKLSTQIKSLPIDADMTLGQAAERDPQLQAALDRALARAKTFKVEYPSHGGANVKIAINLGDVWNELQTPKQ